jgi:DNA-binding NtrC family response regulator
MPEMSGLEVLKRVKEINPQAPVILISGHRLEVSEMEMTKQGAYAFYTKPLRAHQLLEALLKISHEKAT